MGYWVGQPSSWQQQMMHCPQADNINLVYEPMLHTKISRQEIILIHSN